MTLMPLLPSQDLTLPTPAIPVMFGRFLTQERRTSQSVSTRAISSAEIIDAITPNDSVTPKPLTGPNARKNNNAPASRVVMLESMIALHAIRSEEHTSELQSRGHLVCRLLLEK